MARVCLDRLKTSQSKALSRTKPKKMRATIPESGDEDSSTDEGSAGSSSKESIKSKKDPKNLVTKISRMTTEEQGALVEKILMQDFKTKKMSSKTKLRVIKAQSKLQMMIAPVTFTSARVELKERALVDSGAMENLIDEKTWEQLKIGHKTLDKPTKVYNVIGMENKKGEVTHYCYLQIKFNEQDDVQRFYLTNLGGDCIIIGYSFLAKFNPQINWKEGTFQQG
jgi:hypothetical protein